LGDKDVILAPGIGQIRVEYDVGNSQETLIIRNVLYCPKIAHNLLSVLQLNQTGAGADFWDQKCRIFDSSKKLVTVAPVEKGLYRWPVRIPSLSKAFITYPYTDNANVARTITATASLDIWHARLGHIAKDSILRMMRSGMVKGMDVIGVNDADRSTYCPECEAASHHRNPIPSETQTRSDQVLGRVFSDVCELQTVSSEGYKYFITFVDDFSRYLTVYPMKNKSDALDKFKEFLAEAERQTGNKLKILRTDGGGEYFSSDFSNYLKSLGILHEKTNPRTPQENGVAERVNRTLVSMSIAMLKSVESKIGRTSWPYAIQHATFVKNVSPHAALPNDISPHERYTGNKPNVSMLRTFGCNATLHIHRELRRKLDDRSKPGIHLGLARGKKAFLIWDPKARKLHESRDVHFFENDEENSERVTIEVESHNSPTHVVVPADEDGELGERDEEDGGDLEEGEEVGEAEKGNSPPLQPEPVVQDSLPRRSTRIRHAPIPDDDPRYEKSSYNHTQPSTDSVGVAWAMTASIKIPRTYSEAMDRPDADSWLGACTDELNALKETGTYLPMRRDEVDPHNVVGSKWVFALKRGADGEIERYKARIVAKGFNQIYAVDYEETFAPVVKWSSIRILLALGARLDLEIHQMDVKTAFLNGELEHEIFMQPPPGSADYGRRDIVWKLEKSLYGLKQASRAWYTKAKVELNKLGFSRSNSDHAVFILSQRAHFCIVALYVDDLMILSNHLPLLRKKKKQLMSTFKMKDLGEIHWFLGLEITRERQRRLIFVSQSRYISEVVDRFGFSTSRTVSTPMMPNLKLTRHEPSDPDVNTREYQSRIGSVMYAMLGTRPDISFAITILSQYSSNPGEGHWAAINRLLRYLNATKHFKLVYDGNSKSNDKTGYSDSDWAGDPRDSRSISGFVFTMAGAAVSWSSKKQTSVALSSTEGEYMAVTHATKEALWIQQFLRDLNFRGHAASQAGPGLCRVNDIRKIYRRSRNEQSQRYVEI
jgi:hypothetical protein